MSLQGSRQFQSARNISEAPEKRLYGTLQRSGSTPNFLHHEKNPTALFGKHSIYHSHRTHGDYDKSALFLLQRIDNGYYGDIACMGGEVEISSQSGRFNVPNYQIVRDREDKKYCKRRFTVHHLKIVYGVFIIHANIIIVDNLLKTVERFETYGYVETKFASDPRERNASNIEINAVIHRWARRVYFGFKYLSPFLVCPRPGPQRHATVDIGELGFCQTWVLLYADARLRNPDISPDVIQQSLLTYSPDQLHDVVRTFAEKVDREVQMEKNNNVVELQEVNLIDVINRFSDILIPGALHFPESVPPAFEVELILILETCAEFIETSIKDSDNRDHKANLQLWTNLLLDDAPQFVRLRQFFDYSLMHHEFTLKTVEFELALSYCISAPTRSLVEDVLQLVQNIRKQATPAFDYPAAIKQHLQPFVVQLHMSQNETQVINALSLLCESLALPSK